MKTEIAVKKLRSFFRFNKRLPSYSELCRLFNFASKNAAYKLASRLIKNGFIEKDSKGKLIPKKLFYILMPRGNITAGFPSPAEEEISDAVSLDEFLVARPEATFMLKVSGDSMKEAGILPGDLVLVERGRRPKIGDIVIAVVDGQWTIKYFEKKQGKPILVPANKKYPLIKPSETLEICGVVISVIRKYH